MHAVKISALFVLVFMVAGCSTAGRMEELVPPIGEVAIVNQHIADVRVNAIGGDELTVSNEKFISALVQTINRTKVFSSAQNYGDTKYELLVVILTMERSVFGGGVNISSNWILRTADGTEVWSDTVNGTGNSYNFGGVARLRASHERAAKDTIINGVEELSQLSL